MCSWGSGGPGYPILEALNLCLQLRTQRRTEAKDGILLDKECKPGPISMMRLCSAISVLCGQPAQPRPFYPECL